MSKKYGNIIHLHGDNIEQLKQFPDNYFSAVVTDSPYGLGKEPDALEVMRDWIEKGYHEVKGAGFMGKSWDAFVPQPLFWKEVFRVLKPGGHVLSFFGTRTYDWGVMALRFAGFEIRDKIQFYFDDSELREAFLESLSKEQTAIFSQIMRNGDSEVVWNFGCLSDDTEILTKDGFIPYNLFKLANNFKDADILIYDTSTDTYRWENPTTWNEYSIKDTCYRIQSDSTDQIVSRNHRCIVEREGKLLFGVSETIALQKEENFPILENLQKLQQAISDLYKGASKFEQNMFKKLPNKINVRNEKRKNNTSASKERQDYHLCGLRKRKMEAKCLDKKDQNKSSCLRRKMQWSSKGYSMEGTCLQRKVCVDRKVGTGFSETNDRSDKPCMEGRNNLQEKERILFRSNVKVYPMPTGLSKHGKEGWICTGVSTDYGKANRKNADKDRVCSSHRPQSNEQRHNELDVICNEQRPQGLRTRKTYSTTLATIMPFEYEGIIFCPTVSTGAFVARRNGKIFITGNSGFPKSLNVSVAIDKAAGAERKVVSKKETKSGGMANVNKVNKDQGFRPNNYNEHGNTFEVTEPTTDAAKKFSGYGTALKPANEPIVLARKPLEKGLNVAQNVLKWGTGALNIDAARISFKNAADYEESTVKNQHADFGTKPMTDNNVYGDYSMVKPKNYQPVGRWPANLVLSHSSQCVCLGAKKVKGQIDKPTNRTEKGQSWNEENSGLRNNLPQNSGGFADADGFETVEEWECVETCPVYVMDMQSGVSVSAGGRIGNKDGAYNKIGKSGFSKEFEKGDAGFGDEGTASRFFYAAKTSQWERNFGLDGFEEKLKSEDGADGERNKNSIVTRRIPAKNTHPTVKNIAVMRWLLKLVAVPDGIILDPFSGSGTTGCAAKVEGIDMVLIERDLDSHLIGVARCEAWQDDKTMAIIREQEKEEKDPTQLDMFATNE